MNDNIKKLLDVLNSLLIKKTHMDTTEVSPDAKDAIVETSPKLESIEPEESVPLNTPDEQESAKEKHVANIYPISSDILDQDNDEIISEMTSEIIPFSIISGPEYYQFVLDYLATDGYFNDFGNAQKLKWDFDFLSKVGRIINRLYGRRITGITNDSSAILAALVAEAGIYSLVNEIDQVGPVEILNSIKNWTQYLSLTDKIHIFDTVCTETGCTYHPYHKNIAKERGKILILETKDKLI